ncbi:hypothetical protein BTUL_0147g00170 [Botrytis tulipae]|uniref:Uncharacterized protein n=1 Tax=Botrytis tulipae TaxID=87230 RepID=A0A4Z1EHS9_9HELO|nr:hypothetical protein BTUL_0147g00170 [Botrytis tulipae]
MEAGNTSHDENLPKSELIQGDSNNTFTELHVSLSSDLGGSTADLLVKTMKENDLDELRRLLNCKVDLLAMPIATRIIHDDEEILLNLAPLQWAAAFSEPSIINLLLEYGAKVDENIPTIGGTALHLASRFGSKNNIDVLLSQKLNINQKDHGGMTPLHLASFYGRDENVEYLLEAGADYSQLDNYKCLAIYYAASNGELNTLKILHRRGSHKYINEANGYLNAPLHLASMIDHANVVNWLLEKGAAINQPGTGGDTPLHSATSRGHVEIVRELLNNGADIHKRNDNSYSAILIASQNANLGIFILLRGSGAFVSDVGGRDNGTCFHRVILCSREFSSDHYNIIYILVGDGVDIDQVNALGDSPLFLACIKQKLEHVQCLLEYGADVNQMASRKASTPLMEACRLPDSRIVKWLLQHNADTATENSHGMTALTYTVLFNHLEHVKLLIKNGANVICHDHRGITPLRIAVLQKKNIAIALEILAAEQYYPKSPSAKYPYMESTSTIREIEIVLLQGLESSKYETLEQLHIIMYWAVSNGAKDLVDRCIDHDRQVLRWTREGATWLHIASKSGMVGIAQLLLGRMTMQSDAPDQPLGWAAVALIIQPNGRGDSPLAIAIENGHDQLEDLFWYQTEQLQITKKGFIKSHPDIAAQILEFLARHEEPRNEKILKGFLKSDDKRNTRDSEGFTALQWAVCRSQAVIVWWLLSKGGYSSDKINSALKLIVENKDKKSEAIKGLLRAPPSTLDHVSNPNKKHKSKFRKPANSNQVMNYQVIIVDILSRAEPKRAKYAPSSVQELIYDIGPENIMRKAGDLSERDLALLKEAQMENCGASSNRTGIQTKDSPSLDSTSPQHEKLGDEAPSNGNLPESHLRWIHLPVNEDLVSRLSSDLGRSEREHMAIMKHFNKSWTELAAGAERYYMKPQFVRKQEDSHYDTVNDRNGDQAPRESTAGACAALYMPYLDIGTFDRKRDESSNTKSSALLDESINERNSREVKHEPITLDQYYYPTIDDTSTRDNDQVLSKFLQKKSEQSGGRKITHGEPALDLDYRQNRFPDGASSWGCIWAFMKRFVPVSDQIYKGPIEIFRESIRDVAEKESSLFREFLRGLQEAKPWEQKSLEPEQKKERPSSEFSDSKSPDKPMPLNRYHVISSETELLNMIRDIRDELHMLRSLAEDQEIVWKQVFASSDLMHFKAYSPTNVKKDLNAMLSEADKTEDYTVQQYLCIHNHDHRIFGVTALISVPAIIFAWKVNAISSFRPRNNIISETSKHTDAIKGALIRVRRRGKKQHDIEAKQ